MHDVCMCACVHVCMFVCMCVCVCVCICWMLLSNQNFELTLHEVEWVEVVMGVAVGC